MRAGRSDRLPADLEAELAALEKKSDADIDLTDIPEVVDWSSAERGRFYRPVKQLLSVRLDADVIAWFRASGEGYQTRINAALREYVATHAPRR